MCYEQEEIQPIEITDEMLATIRRRREMRERRRWEQQMAERDKAFKEAAAAQQRYKAEHPEPAPTPDNPHSARSVIRTIFIYVLAIILSPLILLGGFIALLLPAWLIGDHPILGYFFFRSLIRRR